MDRDFAGAGYPAGNNTPPSMLGIDEAYLNGYLSGLSFQSILQPTCPYDVGVGGGVSPLPALETPAFSPATYGYFNQESPTTYQFLNPQELKMPKHEDLSTEDFAFQLLKLNETTTNAAVSPPEPLINFFSTTNSTTSISSFDDVISCGGCFADHLSLEPKKPNIAAAAAAAAAPQLVCQTGSLNDIMNVVQPADSFPTHRVGSVPSSSSSLSSSRYMPYKKSGLARQRRQRISEKTRCLQRLLPWDKKMDMGTMLEEAYKYIKFLQAQINVLQNMPLKTSPSFGGGSQNPTTTSSSSNDVVWGELGKLSRQQLLEVVVNSPVAQTVLYSRGCCVYSMEQLVLLRKFAEKKALLEQVLFASPLLFY